MFKQQTLKLDMFVHLSEGGSWFLYFHLHTRLFFLWAFKKISEKSHVAETTILSKIKNVNVTNISGFLQYTESRGAEFKSRGAEFNTYLNNPYCLSTNLPNLIHAKMLAKYSKSSGSHG